MVSGSSRPNIGFLLKLCAFNVDTFFDNGYDEEE